jgi:hypothetical protein
MENLESTVEKGSNQVMVYNGVETSLFVLGEIELCGASTEIWRNN